MTRKATLSSLLDYQLGTRSLGNMAVVVMETVEHVAKERAMMTDPMVAEHTVGFSCHIHYVGARGIAAAAAQDMW